MQNRLLQFQSTSSVWRTTPCPAVGRGLHQHFNPRPPCGGRRGEVGFQISDCCISIHVLRVEDDQGLSGDHHRRKISIHVLRVEDDIPELRKERGISIFQSTSSVWRTTSVRSLRPTITSISIHVLRVEDDISLRTTLPAHDIISIHVLRVEDDLLSAHIHNTDCTFQSTSSVWRTTGVNHGRCNPSSISIHVLRVEDDAAEYWPNQFYFYFNPRPPCGGRPQIPGWEAHQNVISIHVLRVEDDVSTFKSSVSAAIFQSTSSVWRTTPAAKTA